MKYFKYLSYVLKHKWYVFVECCKMGIPWRGLVHDLSKFLPSEFFAYADFFSKKNLRNKIGYYKPTNTGHAAFDFAWFLHQKRNKHHWQWWILPDDGGKTKVLPMPDKYRREMLCDWLGAAKAQDSKSTVKEWYLANGRKMTFHPETKKWIEKQLDIRGVEAI